MPSSTLRVGPAWLEESAMAHPTGRAQPTQSVEDGIPTQSVGTRLWNLATQDARNHRIEALPCLFAESAETAACKGHLLMGVNWQAGQEPIAGYRLIEKLGEGGFGEVWKAEAPGGFTVALKAVLLDKDAGKVELRSLDIIRKVTERTRHCRLYSS